MDTLSHKVKDVGFRIRIDKDLREQFLKVCRSQDKPAAQVIREFMRTYVREMEHGESVPDAANNEQREPNGH
ncbi:MULTISPECIES: hypothetical protein [unclassified Sulfitobacter]|uniref:hypothetical protein n=1 Tax=unclassified Sulfitobacter TaxID=196795 RepID=UPI0007C338AC|nr:MULTISPECIES: hypothetical protein [unclassified Sulfitobacter]KZX94250.1 hypothetical protein A3720_04610 [Sulfitobacter sp. HI0021]KZX95377.1 hypothetical protein A3722_18370 [Sulfitobacter sp. HI0027]KZZ03321.1 hypothetical protein A3747_12235 [Sulfitobacter sp. HI0076]